MADNHQTIRAMLGLGERDKSKFPLQTLKDNVRLLTVEMLVEINAVVVGAGHALVKKTARWKGAVTASWWSPTCISPPTPTCSGPPSARRSC